MIETLRTSIVTQLRDFLTPLGGKCCLGSSGGIDSALVISLACDAVGPENVWGFRMPSPNNDPQDEVDALELHEALKCNDILSPLFDYKLMALWMNAHMHTSMMANRTNVNPLSSNLPDSCNSVANENLQARLRAVTLMHFSNTYGPLLLGTDNKVESYLGYFTLYGDSCGAIRPIGSLYKREVVQMSRLYPVPENILTKAPSAGLKKGQTDEEALLPYPVLDKIVEGYSELNITQWEAFKAEYRGVFVPMIEQEDYERIIAMIAQNAFKDKQCPPVIEVNRKD